MTLRLPVADFYVGRGETAEYLGSIWGDMVGPEDLRAITRFQSQTDALYDEVDYRRDIKSLIAEYSTDERGTGPDSWPHRYGTSGASDWAYCFDKASVHIYEEGHLVLTILCNGARKPSEFPWRGGVESAAE